MHGHTITFFTTCCALLALIWPSPTHAIPVSRFSTAPALSKRRSGVEIPFQRRKFSRNDLHARGTVSGSIGLGDNADLIYTVPIEIGNTVTAVHLDTGSSDLWVVSDACTANDCANPNTTKIPTSSLNLSGTSVTMRYGDSTTGTQASGPIAFDTATIAGIAMKDSPFAAVNSTTSDIVKYGSSGLFGLGFPSGSVIQKTLAAKNAGSNTITSDAIVEASYKDGPLLSRIASTNELEKPMFSISLQRHTIDIGGGSGTLTVGKLPDGVDENSLTWVPVRLYKEQDGGLPAPSSLPNEVYPFRWEIDIEGVFLDGQKLPDSQIAATGGVDTSRTTALIDTGNSLLRGPEDVVKGVWKTLAPDFDVTQVGRAPLVACSTPINMAFQIGGKMFPVDPRDFIGPATPGDTTNCVADNIVVTDPPAKGALFRWSLGDPFFKSNLVAFHYGNLTHPSVDPPKIGLLSTVPSNANDLLVQAVKDAKANGGNFESTLAAAPTAQAASEGQITLTHTVGDSETASPSATSAASGSNNNSKPNSSTHIRTSLYSFVFAFIPCLYFAFL